MLKRIMPLARDHIAEIESAKLRYQLNLADDLAVAAQSLAQLGYVCLSRLMENGDATVIHSGPL